MNVELVYPIIEHVKQVFCTLMELTGEVSEENSSSGNMGFNSKRCGYFYLQDITWHLLKKYKTSILLSDLVILEVIVSGGDITSFRIDLPLLRDLENEVQKLEKGTSDG